MNKQKIVDRLRHELQSVIAERRAAKSDPAAYVARVALRRFQTELMACTHADLLASRETSAAAHFS